MEIWVVPSVEACHPVPVYLISRVMTPRWMDDQLLDAICECLVSSLNTQGTYIVWEGDPAADWRVPPPMEAGTGFLDFVMLKTGDFCGGR
ncbi:CYCLIC NUCLEOTIDE-GATED ION CHANNEL 15-RELATED-RELATED [Salix koriyanagi]|uniref:CYCLIC NUCLEOTIDE-GATED ION CHANNEL 15-RELATED-RELATED n=1 Tax=Salix koriyanagi TaxID=2511006 RepID=A0A9Q0VES4_9ROSI|nr:CYCLIC NUCLEOTIDE-GATED ION CHANNEL 15-RELATED-RELATED [Salix koriyanagi]